MFHQVLLKIIAVIIVVFIALIISADGIITEFSSTNLEIISKIRLPRVITALVCGASLALAGVLLQALLRNPLADPYVLGVSGGGSVSAMLVMLLGLAGIWVLIGTFVGSLLSLVLIYWMAKSRKLPSSFSFRLILSGIILASLWAALVNLILLISPSAKLPGMIFWLLGDLNSLIIPWLAIVILGLSTIVCLLLSKSINLLMFNELMAQSLGLSLVWTQWIALIISSLLIASVVSIAGNIGFVGLVVPHLIRMLGKRTHQQLIPNAIFFGAILLVVADWLSRVVVAPLIIPVGIITTIIGAPLFIYLLRKTHG